MNVNRWPADNDVREAPLVRDEIEDPRIQFLQFSLILRADL
jgi:hypothetical protein